MTNLSFQLSDNEGNFLVKLARHCVDVYLTTGNVVKAPQETPEKLFQQCGVFVTISIQKSGHKSLRGCIGYPYPTLPLVEAVIDAGINSATQDPRFPPMSQNELNKVVFEISVLTPPELITVEKPEDYIKRIKVGQDGLIVEKGYSKGLLLPQVPVEWGWSEEEFLCQCSIKAGLSRDSWLTKGAKIYKFRAIIFEELKPCGEIRRKSLSEP